MRFYRNLNGRNGVAWSIKDGSNPVQHAAAIYAESVSIKQPSGKAFEQCLEGGHRAVCAWFKSDSVQTDDIPPIPSDAVRVRFNPKEGQRCFSVDGVRVDSLHRVWCDDSGQCFAIVNK